MGSVNITLNGKEVTVPEGTTILEAARMQGVEIPTLCHDPKLPPFTSCFLCVVEVEGARTLVPACATKVAEGQKINTESEAVRQARKMALELLLSDHYGDCVAPCSMRCPANIDIQAYISLIADKRYKDAVKVIKQRMPMPVSIGRVCPRPCETQCRRTRVDEPQAINYLKRFVADRDLLQDEEPYRPEVAPPTGKRVAIVGAGPAGLSCAYYLSIMGHEVEIFEARDKAGGMFRWGIPDYRLPQPILDKEIEHILSFGAKIHYNMKLGEDFTISSLKKEKGFDAIFVGIGAQLSSSMRMEGEETEGVTSGIGFLELVARGKPPRVGSRVVVVGGGNTAIDAVRTSIRLGAEEVILLYRRSRAEMPANEEEIVAAEHEGVKFHFLASPVKAEKGGSKRVALHCVRMRLGEPDASGRRRPEPIEGSEFVIEADTVIGAIGQKVDVSWLEKEEERLALTRWNTIEVIDESTCQTSVPYVFAGGDCVTGADLGVSAIGAGRRAAEAIDRYLRGLEIKPVQYYNHTKGSSLEDVPESEFEGRERIPRVHPPELPVETRIRNFEEVEGTISEEEALREAGRCLQCGCQDVHECALRKYATKYGPIEQRFGLPSSADRPDSSHAYIIRDEAKCIKCARCIRICSEIQGKGVLGFIGRGFDTVVSAELGKPFGEIPCESCGQCVASCPVGALVEKVPAPMPGPVPEHTSSGICCVCGVGCSIEVKSFAGRVRRIVPAPVDKGVNRGNLCAMGRFEALFSYDPDDLLTSPLVRDGDRLVEVSWDEALDRAARILGDKGRKAVVCGGRVTCEEALLLKELAEGPLNGATRAAAFYRSGEWIRKATAVPCREYEVLDEADLIVVLHEKAASSVLGNFIVARALDGTAVLTAGMDPSHKMGFHSKEFIRVEAASELLRAFERIREGRWWKEASRRVVVTVRDLLDDDLLDLLASLGDEARIVAGWRFGNAEGVHRLLGTDAGVDEALNLDAEAALVVDVDEEWSPEGSRCKVVQLNPRRSGILPAAEVVLPGSGFGTREGTFVNAAGVSQHMNAALLPASGRFTWQALSELSSQLGGPAPESLEELTREVRNLAGA